jgi:hypothetical protein
VEEIVLDLNEYLSIWPNPALGGVPLGITFTPPPEFVPDGPLRVVVQDALGRRVSEHRLLSGTDQVALPKLASGTYHLHLCDDRRWLAGRTVVVE